MYGVCYSVNELFRPVSSDRPTSCPQNNYMHLSLGRRQVLRIARYEVPSLHPAPTFLICVFTLWFVSLRYYFPDLNPISLHVFTWLMLLFH
jgi:hypothetical protein